jgi:hypothetical protein
MADKIGALALRPGEIWPSTPPFLALPLPFLGAKKAATDEGHALEGPSHSGSHFRQAVVVHLG